MRNKHFIVQYLITLLLLGFVLDAWGGNYPTDGELNSLPSYCRVKLRVHYSQPEYQNLVSSFGSDFQHVHHYCAALNFMNRYSRTFDVQEKKSNLQEALNNFNYMVNGCKPEFILMPEIYMNRAIAYSLAKRPANAIIDLEKSISLNPKLTRAYILLADYQVELKQGSKALSAVTEGLRQIPNSRSLQKRYVELGGNLPYPEPYQKPEEQKAVAEEKNMAKEVMPGDATPEQAKSNEPKPAATQKDIEQPTIGMPGNPWCRFCPDLEEQKAGQPPAKP
jgi:tetratricopeptide (TPR) repeat protein